MRLLRFLPSISLPERRVMKLINLIKRLVYHRTTAGLLEDDIHELILLIRYTRYILITPRH